MRHKIPDNWQSFKLKISATEKISKALLWIVAVIISIFIPIILFILNQCFGTTLSESITIFLSSSVALFAFVNALSGYLNATREREKRRLSEIKEEIETVYAPLYSIFSKKWTYTQEKEFVIVNTEDKDNINKIISAHPFFLEPMPLRIWRFQIERLEPIKGTESNPVFAIPHYFVTHITMQYDNLTDEYQKRTGLDIGTMSSTNQRIERYPTKEEEKTIKQIILEEQAQAAQKST
jgi:hypothetical protein